MSYITTITIALKKKKRHFIKVTFLFNYQLLTVYCQTHCSKVFMSSSRGIPIFLIVVSTSAAIGLFGYFSKN